MDRGIQSALQAAGDHAGAFLWRRLCRDLDGPLRVTTVARSIAVLRRTAEALETTATLDLVPLPDSADDQAGLGLQDRLLGCHALLWVTPYPTALGAEERQRLQELESLGAPAARAVVLEGAALLERLSDSPEAERADVRDRVRSLLPSTWVLLDASEVDAWLDELGAQTSTLAQSRRAEVARVLLRDAWQRATGDHEQAKARLVEAEDALAEEHAAIDAAHQRGRRIAAHLLSAVRGHTESLLVDLRDFLLRLEDRVQPEVDTMTDLDQIQRVLPHWLHHVVEAWLLDRISRWRAAVLSDLAEVHLSEDEAPAPELLAPALHPANIRGERDWNTRLAATAAVSGGAALMLLGQWIPGVLAITGGVAWSALSRGARASESRRRLVETAQSALRQMGQEAESVLRDQLVQIEVDLARLADARAADASAERADARAALVVRRDREAERAEHAGSSRAALMSAIQEIDPHLAAELAS